MVERWLSAWAREGVTRRTHRAGQGQVNRQDKRRGEKGVDLVTAGEMWAGLSKIWGQGVLTYSGQKPETSVLGGQLESREGFSVVRGWATSTSDCTGNPSD